MPPRRRRARSASSPSSRRSSDSRIATPSSKSRRSPASIFSRIGSSVGSVENGDQLLLSTTASRQRLELVPPRGAVEAGPGLRSVVEGHLARSIERTGRGDANEGALQRPARERSAHDRVLPRGEEKRQRRRAVPEVRARHLARLDRLAAAVEDVVRDLERDAEQAAVLTAPATEDARGLEELPGLERAALEVVVDRRVGIVALAPLHCLAARERERGVRQHGDGARIARRRQAPRTPGRTGSRRPPCAASSPCSLQAAARPRRTAAPSIRSSWTSVAMCTSSTATPAANRRRRPRETTRGTRARAAAACRRPRERRLRSRRRGPDTARRHGRARSSTSRRGSRRAPERRERLSSARHGLMRGPTCRATIPPPRSAIAHVLEACALEERREIVRPREAPHARGKVRVGLPAREGRARERDEDVEPEAEERPQDAARTRDLEHRELPPGAQDTRAARAVLPRGPRGCERRTRRWRRRTRRP